MQQMDQPGLTFDQRVDRRAMVFADHEIALPMASLRAIVGLEGSLVVSIGCSNVRQRRSLR
jgi:hypothetical protein